MSISASDFGIREWRYAGDNRGYGRMSFTTIFIGPGEVSSRLPAMAIVAFAATGVAGLGFTVVSLFRSRA
jgi:hypothetical protein